MANQPETQSCGNCRFQYNQPFDDNEENEENISVCRRNPPSLIPDPEESNCESAYPETGEDDWCGEWSPANPETIEDAAVVIARFVILGDKTGAYTLVDKLKEIR